MELFILPQTWRNETSCPTCGWGTCPGAKATPMQRARKFQELQAEWAEKDIPRDEWQRWCLEFLAAQLECAQKSAREAALPFTVGRELFAFRSFNEWRNKARSWFKTCGVISAETVCVDSAGRICATGKQFMRADREGTFPVRVFAIEKDA